MRRRSFMTMALVALLAGCGAGAESPATSGEGVPALDAGKVPAELRDLVPLVQTWGIGDDVLRGRRIEAATAEQREELRRAFAPKQRQITEWLNSFGTNVMPDEAAAFMYTQLAIEEMP